MISLLSLLLLLTTVSANLKYSLLSPEENIQLQSTCGLDPHYHTKVLNGNASGEFPWAAAVNVKGVLTASVISPRHILLFNVFEFDKETMRLSLFNETDLIDKGHCDVNDWILPEEVNEWFVVRFANDKSIGMGENKIRRIVVLGGCIDIDTYKPMILELENDMQFDKGHGAICIPSENDDVVYEDEQEFTVYGLGPKGNLLTSAQFIRNNHCQEEHPQNFVFCGKPVNDSRGLCSGDFGGGAIAKSNNNRNVLLGVYAEGNIRCENSPESHQEPEFIDIYDYAESICRQTGVCPNAKEEISTEGPYISVTDEETEVTEESTTSASPTTVTLETLIAETFEKMKLENCSHHEGKEIHIHIHLDRDTLISNN